MLSQPISDLFSAQNVLSETGVFVVNNGSRTVRNIIKDDWEGSSEMLILTGYTSLEYLLSIFGKKSPISHKVEIVLGNEPTSHLSQSGFTSPAKISKEYKEYWLRRGISIMNMGNLLNLIERIQNEEISFKLHPKLHGKVYISDKSALMGSSNLSRNGFELNREVNARFYSDDDDGQYHTLKKIASHYASEATDITHEILELFEQLLKAVTWEEALARGISEILEGQWMRNYLNLISRYQNEQLWPTQVRAIAQALYIIDQQGSVLIAEPTGAGKTKIGSYLMRILYDRSNRRGMGHVTNYVMITPPSVMDNWDNEVRKIGTMARPVSQGMVSKGGDNVIDQIRRSNLLLIDEAHNYLNRNSGRSKFLAQNLADHVLLFTATPINKKSHDLLRIIELLGPDNLSPETNRDFDNLRKVSARSMHTDKELDNLRQAISKVMVRHTKKQINQIIEADPSAFKNKEGKECRYPKQTSRFYDLPSSSEDEQIAEKINELCGDLKGLAYLSDWRDAFENAQLYGVSLQQYVDGRLNNAPALAVYRIKNSLRSSKLALIEHLMGTSFALKAAGLKKVKTSETGNIIGRHSSLVIKNVDDKIKPYLPEWLTNHASFEEMKQIEIENLNKIYDLATQISTTREEQKADQLIRLTSQHRKILAYDSTLITTAYIKKLVKDRVASKIDVVQISGEATEKEKSSFQKRFDFGSGGSDKCIAICTDAVSEGVNLQQASAVVFLDMPTVIRKAEQRAGRVDRLDSPHDEIEIYWPRDTRAFQLKTDKKFLTRLDIVDRVIGSNLYMPEESLELFDVEAEQFAKEYQSRMVAQQESDWEGLEDAFAPVKNLIGTEGIIDEQLYKQMSAVEATVVSKVSCVTDEINWAFFALKGTETHAPQWLLINDRKKVITDLSSIADFITSRSDKLVNGMWDEKTQRATHGFLLTLKKSARQLLPNRKKLLFNILDKNLKKGLRGDSDLVESHNRLRYQFDKLNTVKNPDQEFVDEMVIDWYDLGHSLLELIVKDKRFGYDRFGKKSIRLKNIMKEILADPVMLTKLSEELANPPYMPPFEHRIVAAIVAVKG